MGSMFFGLAEILTVAHIATCSSNLQHSEEGRSWWKLSYSATLAWVRGNVDIRSPDLQSSH